MTAEKVFPKSDGDISYASEVNNFALSSKYIGSANFTITGSATAFVTIGSFLFGAGSLSNPVFLEIPYSEVFTGAGFGGIKITLSGLSSTNVITANPGPTYGYVRAMIGSPMYGWCSIDGAGTGASDGAQTIINHKYTGSPLVLFVDMTCNTTSGAVTMNMFMHRCSYGGY